MGEFDLNALLSLVDEAHDELPASFDEDALLADILQTARHTASRAPMVDADGLSHLKLAPGLGDEQTSPSNRRIGRRSKALGSTLAAAACFAVLLAGLTLLVSNRQDRNSINEATASAAQLSDPGLCRQIDALANRLALAKTPPVAATLDRSDVRRMADLIDEFAARPAMAGVQANESLGRTSTLLRNLANEIDLGTNASAQAAFDAANKQFREADVVIDAACGTS